MNLMRHTDMRLTMKVYTDPKVFNLAGAVAKLPVLGSGEFTEGARRPAPMTRRWILSGAPKESPGHWQKVLFQWRPLAEMTTRKTLNIAPKIQKKKHSWRSLSGTLKSGRWGSSPRGSAWEATQETPKNLGFPKTFYCLSPKPAVARLFILSHGFSGFNRIRGSATPYPKP
jgi:hypothetical protein